MKIQILFYLRSIYSKILLGKFKYQWRKINIHNSTKVINAFPIDIVRVGNYTYGPLEVYTYGNPEEKLEIGNYCSIANNVKFLLGGEHHPKYVSNYPFKLFIENRNINFSMDDRATKGPIIINDDVWIGRDTLILSGVTIGQGAIIAAGSVITKDVPPYAICTTNRIIKYRFKKEIICELLKFDYSKIDNEFIRENINLFYNENIDEVLNNDNFRKYMRGR